MNPHPQSFNYTSNQKKASSPTSIRLPTRRRAFSESLDLRNNRNNNDNSNGVPGQRFKQIWKLLTLNHHHSPHASLSSPIRSPDTTTTTPKISDNSSNIDSLRASSLPSEIGFYMPVNDRSNNNHDNRTVHHHLHNSIQSKNQPEFDYFNEQYHPLSVSSIMALENATPPLSTSSGTSTPISSSSFKRRLGTKRHIRRKAGIEGKFREDVIGVTFLEICHAKDLPPEKNLTRTSFDMDPFVVVSYGTSSFRTSAVRHNLNPVWNEKLFFHVRHHEANFHLKFTVYDREKFSGNDLVAWCQVPLQDIIRTKETREEQERDDMDLHTFSLQMANSDKWKYKRRPTLTIRAKFMPYDQIRKMFWAALAKTYDTDNSGSLTKLEVQSMLKTIGSTVTESTIDAFWLKRNLDPNNEDNTLTLDQLVKSLEDHMRSDESNNYADKMLGVGMSRDTHEEKAMVEEDLLDDIQYDIMHMSTGDEEDDEDEDDEDEDEDEDDWTQDDDCDNDDLDRLIMTDEDDDHLPYNGNLDLALLDPSFPRMPSIMEQDIDLTEVLIEEEDNRMLETLDTTISEINTRPGIAVLQQQQQQTSADNFTTSIATTVNTRRRRGVEKVIRLKECPICHRPNLARKSQMDIITHVATCAANDWTTVDRFLVRNFLTEAYAQRRWFVKLVRTVGYGRYSLGKDNANIIVQDRRTGQLIEEKMLGHVKLGMRLVYKGMKTGIQSKGAQRILTNLTLRQGRNYDSPNSVREIPAFIKFHNIQLHEVWKPVSSFRTFNEFFYRKLRPGARPVDSPDDPNVAVSPADSRMTAFESVSEATRLWIKGMDFSLKKLLGNSSSSAKIFEGGSLAVFRLAPQDYHRFHSPVDGVITRIKHISGQYYTVNPMAIRTTIDVFGENTRTIIWMESEEFGQVAIVCVGAMLVGSIIVTAQVGSKLKRSDEMGYFAFGGSTLIVVFQKGKMNFDHDLLDNSDRTLETLVRVGNHIGELPSQ